jgi:hypothetical protein
MFGFESDEAKKGTLENRLYRTPLPYRLGCGLGAREPSLGPYQSFSIRRLHLWLLRYGLIRAEQCQTRIPKLASCILSCAMV